MSEYLDLTALSFVGITAVIALAVALADLLLIRQHKGTARLEELKPAVDSVLVIAGFMATVGMCIVIIRVMTYLAKNGLGWNWDGATNSIFVEPGTARLFVTEMIRTTMSILITCFMCFVIYEVWCLLHILLRRYVRKLTAA